ncbi:MAG: PAS domain-containing protein [Labilithrix sp.]|nr:PAS domain-containing protein [Labilithrix sp.]MCW5815343.1 PAS domain-containing protein [Labilithrix sp.]
MAQTPSHVVGIGASAGGLEALERFFDHVESETRMAFVVVQHLSPDFKSVMDELLRRHTDLPVHLVEEAMPVEAGHVYLIPPKKEMIISGGKLHLSERDRLQELTLPIDVFFRSLAQDCGPRAIAIVLSGGGSDGSRGIRAVHDAGGLVVVQDTESAQFNGMPKTARDAGVAHWILRPDEMPQVIAEHARSGGTSQSPAEPTGFDGVYQMLQHEFGIDFTHYKPSTVTRRIERRLKLARAADLDAYIDRLRAERGELDVLYRDLLIGVTRFFRNEEAFTMLEQKILPELAKSKKKGDPLRVWVAGCATGEEAYSVAILLHELASRSDGLQVKLFATDVHRGSLEIAARGIYNEEAIANVSPERLERYFWRHGKAYQIVPDLRQLIVFAPHDVIRDAPFTRVDLVTCRNLLIYLQPPAQQKVLSLFHFALNRGGVLFLGPSETLGTSSADFETLDRHWHFYRKFSDVRIPVETRVRPARPITLAQTSPPTGRLVPAALLATYDTLLEELMPPSLLVSERGELVHVFGGASKFLVLRDGRPGLDVRDVLDDELKVIVGGGIQRALRSDDALVFRNVREHKITVRKVRSAAGAAHVLVSFEPEPEDVRTVTPRAETEIDVKQISSDQIGQLENELSVTKENLQAAIEELETSNEELQAANEELLASNEELQSTNEELQSVNEELYTVNAEYQRKITELTELTNDMDNLLSSTDIGTIFLDRKLRIRRFTPRVADAFNLLPQDVGRSITTFASNIEHPDLATDLARVVETGEPVEREIHDRAQHAFLLRILPYRAKGTVDGAVVTLIDVRSLKAAENALREAVNRRDQFLAMLSHELRNPLGAIVTATTLLDENEDVRESGGKFLSILKRQSAQMARLLDDLLEASRVTQNKIELKRRVLDLRTVAREAVDVVRSVMDARGIALVAELPSEPVWVDGDATRLQQIQVNLLNNAAKYTPRGGHVRLSLGVEERRAIVRVVDDGAGISADMLPNVFDLFVQSKRTLDRSEGGLGLGLTLVRALVTMHGGDVTAASEGEGKGTTMTVRLPLASAPAHSESQGARERGRRLEDGALVIVVEDSPDACEMMCELLAQAGLDCRSANDGPSGLDLIVASRPAAAIVDVGLPGMDGFEIARRVRARPELTGIFLVALTGYGRAVDRERALESGFDEHIVKPVDPEKLVRLLGRRRAFASR